MAAIWIKEHEFHRSLDAELLSSGEILNQNVALPVDGIRTMTSTL